MLTLKTTIVFCFLVLFIFPFHFVNGAPPQPLSQEFEPRTILVGMAKSALSLPESESSTSFDRCFVSEDIAQAFENHSPSDVSRVFPGFDSADYPERFFAPPLELFLAIHFSDDVDVLAVVAGLSGLEGVLFAEPNHYVQMPDQESEKNLSLSSHSPATDDKSSSGPPNDTVYWGTTGGWGDQWNLHDDATGFGIGCEKAWEYTTGDPLVRIGVLEDGVWWNHDDLNVVDGFRVIPPGGVGGGGVYTTSQPDTSMYKLHGTKCAGIIGSTTNNGFGISGIAGGNNTMPGCSILDLQLTNNMVNNETVEAWAFAIETAADPMQSFNCDVISISIRTNTYSETLRAAIRFAHSVGTNIVCSNGNVTTPPVRYPAGFDEPWVFAVGAFDSSGVPIYDSEAGSPVDLLGPGERCPTIAIPGLADPNQTYQDYILTFFSATSCAAPHVAGSVGLLRSLLGNNLNPEDYENILKLSSDDPVNGDPQSWDIDFGHGRLKVGDAVKNAAKWDIIQYSTQKTKIVDQTAVSIQFISGPYTQITPAMRYKILGTIQFGNSFSQVPKVWGPCQPAYFFGFHGFSTHSPNYGEPFHGIEPGTVTLTSCDVYTYVYKIWDDGVEDYVHWYPAQPSQIPVTVKAFGPLSTQSKKEWDKKRDVVTSVPNPFNSHTTISFSNRMAGNVTIDIFDLRGRLVQNLLNKFTPAGSLEIFWDGTDQNGRNVGSGIFFLRVHSESETTVKKLILAK